MKKKLSNPFIHRRVIIYYISALLLSVIGIISANAQPVITNISATSGIPGTTAITITGTGFNTTAANNVLYFGSAKATPTAATATSLTATVPFGADLSYITETNTATALTGYSSSFFFPTYNNALYLPGISLSPKVDYALPSGAGAFDDVAGDMDGDGKPDLLISNDASSISVFRNTSTIGSISFATRADFTTSGETYWAAVGDIDGDGKLDALSVDYANGKFSVFRNTSTIGNISFAARVDVSVAAGSGTYAVTVGDIDNDGKPDVVVVNYNTHNVTVYRNITTGTTISFAAGVVFNAGASAGTASIILGDLDADGKLDMVSANYSNDTTYIYRNTSVSGTISFATPLTIAFGTSQPFYASIADLDGDGKPDFAVAENNGDTIALFRNTSTAQGIISFAPAFKLISPNTVVNVAIGDINGDGKPDISGVSYGSSTGASGLFVYQNTSTSGTFSFATDSVYTTTAYPVGVAICDLDGDNKPDLAVVNEAANNYLSIYRNNPRPAVYYYKGTGDITSLANWGTNTDGTGTAPASFAVAGYSYYVTNASSTISLLSSWTVGTNTGGLIIAAGKQIALGAYSINVAGYLNDSGTITGTGSVVLSGTAAQTITDTGVISNLILNNTAGATITAGDTVKITGTYTNTAGTLTTNSGLTLVSNTTGTGRIGTIAAGAITGNVNTQQYIPGNRRAFRFLAHPFSTSIALSQLENYIDITGTGGSTNGFSTTQNNNPSAFWYNLATGDTVTVGNNAGWTAFTSTNGSGNNAWNAKEGIRVLVRGAKAQGLNGLAYTPSAVIYTLNGPVNQGAISIPFTLGANTGYNVLGNPYPSPTDIGTPINTAKTANTISGTAFWVWNSESQTQGAYVTLPIGSAYSIPANASFVVKAASSNNLAFTEANKTATGTALFKPTADNKYTKLIINDSAGDNWDVLYLSFNPGASILSEDNDADKLHNTALDFYSLSSDNKELSIDARPYQNNQIIPLGLQTSVQQAYTIKADAVNVPAGAQLVLHDKYLNQYQALAQGSEYTFTVTNDANSQGDTRFELSTVGSATSIVAVSSNSLQVSLSPNPASDKAIITYTGANDKIQVFVTDVMGKVVYTASSNNNNGMVILPLQGLSSGNYMIITRCGDQKIINKLVKE